MTPSETSDLVAALCEMYPREQVGPLRVRMYCELLADLEHEAALAAVRRVVCKSEWFPSVAAIRAEVAATATDAYPAPAVAWGAVVQAIRRYGMNRIPEFANPIAAEAVESIGWRELCLSDEGDAAVRAQFREAYRALSERRRNDIRVPAIARTPDQRKRLGAATPLGETLKRLTGEADERETTQSETAQSASACRGRSGDRA